MRLEGQTLDIYRIGEELGRGGMGTVYRAVSDADGPAGPAGSVVALKVFHAHLAREERLFARFRREAEIGRRISHPHIVRTFDLGREQTEAGPVSYMVMELIRGQTLAGLVDELGTVPEQLRFQIADQVLDALERIHGAGIVHRDVKPENVVITPDHRVLLMDLGIARLQEAGHTLTEAGEFVGSIEFAAPEQFSGGATDVGPSADLYALGVVLYNLSTGKSPFGRGNVLTVLQQKLQEDLPPPRVINADVDAFWDAVIVTATQKDLEKRFSSATEMRRVLKEGEAGDWWRTRAERAGRPLVESALKRLQLPREAPLLGRTDALARLRAAWRGAKQNGGTFLVGGQSGVGKSRLVYEFLEQVAGEGGTAIAAGRCIGSEGRRYQPFIEGLGDLLLPVGVKPADRRAPLEERLAELLADTPGVVSPLADFLLGGLQQGAEGALSKDALLAACARVLQRLSGDRPLIFVVEDLQLAGSDSVELFRYVMRATTNHPLLLVGIYTDEEVVEDGPLHEIVAGPAPAGAERLGLGPLDPAATEDLVRAVVGSERSVRSLAHPLHEQSEGNAFFILEMLADLRSQGVLVEREDGVLDLARPVAELNVPSSVRDAVGIALGRLDDDQRETLEAAAVIGYEFQAPLLASVLEQKRIHLLRRLAVLERKNRVIVSAGKRGFRFAGHHVYQAVYDAIQPDLREEYHGLVADTIQEQLEDEAPDGASSFALLRHLSHAGRATEAEPFLETALDYLGAAFHASYAVPFLEEIATAFEDAPPAKRFAIAMRQWIFYDLLASRADQMRVLELARDLAAEIDDPGRRARVHTLRAGSYWYAGDYERAVAEAETGLALAREGGDRTWEAACHHTLGAVAFRRGDLTTAARELREALAIRREIGDRRGQASTLQALALVMPGIGEDAEVLAAMEEALEIWGEIGERRGEAAVLMNLGIRLVDQGRGDEGLRHLEEAIARHRETGALLSEALGLANIGRAHEVQGRFSEACGAWNRALQLFVELDDPNGEIAVRSMMASALVTYGGYDEAGRHLERALALAEEKGAKAKLVVAHCEMGRLLKEQGESAASREHLEKALAYARETGSVGSRVTALGMLGAVALAEGDPERAIPYLEEALPDARQTSAGSAALVLSRYAHALDAVGRKEEATGLAREAADRLAEAGDVSPAYGPEIYAALAEVLRDDARGPALAEQARALAEARARLADREVTCRFFVTDAEDAAREGGQDA